LALSALASAAKAPVANAYSCSWISGGGGDVVTAMPGNLVPVVPSDCPADAAITGQVVLFNDSAGGKRDCLKISWDHKSEKSWSSATIAAREPWSWAAVDASKAKALVFWIRGAVGGETYTISIATEDKRSTGALTQPEVPVTTAAWTRIVLPLAKFPGVEKLDLSKVSGISIATKEVSKAVFFLDNIYLSK
jgi:hypothetical protein